ncbi:multicopper oxidase, partial [Thalassiosira oceanica]
DLRELHHDKIWNKKRPRGSYEIEYSDKNADGDDTCCWEWCDVKNCSGFELEDVETYKPNNNYIPVCFGDRVRILFINSASFEGSEGHPMHLHGHNFVLRELFNVSDDGQQLVYSAEYGKDQYNISGPRVDSIWVPFNQAVAFDFDAYNPGEHLFHCHNDFHLENGMTTTIRYMHDEYCRNSLPEFKGGKNNYPTQFCEMDNCSPP